MSYNPGVTDISGQIRAQGMLQAGQYNQDSLASAGEFVKQYRQNKQMASQAIGKFEGALQANPELLQFLNPDQPNPNAPPESVKAFAKLQKDGTLALKDAATLATFADSYMANKTEAQKNSLIQQQIEQSKAQMADLQAQAKQRDLAAQMAARQQKMMEDVFSNANPGADLSTPAQSPVDQFHAPTAPAPTRRDVMISLAKATGQMPKVDEVNTAYDKAKSSWDDVERPLGYVAGGVEKDKEGKDVQTYYPVTIKNNGSILQAKEPLKIYADAPAPGRVLDSTTFKPLAQQPAPAMVAGQPARPNLGREEQKDIVDISNNVAALRRGLSILDSLDAADSAINKNRTQAANVFLGRGKLSDVYNDAKGAMGDTSGIDFNTQASKFKADVMSGVKNIRNVYEFKAVTGDVPEAGLPAESRRKLLDSLREKLGSDLGRSQRALALLQRGATPDTAWADPAPEMEKVGKAAPMQLTPDLARKFLQEAGGDKAKARKLAKDAGYAF